jgi:hypothetical protein
MAPIMATTFCPGASPLPTGAASTMPAASMPGTRGKLTPSLTPSRRLSTGPGAEPDGAHRGSRGRHRPAFLLGQAGDPGRSSHG